MPAMVAQSTEWDSGPSRVGSMLSLDGGRQRPPTAKTPPSYYDAVRSRHSLSQPVHKSPESLKQEKGLHVQQVKYNSLPRPLPQRCPPGPSNGHLLRDVWSDERTNGHGPPDPCPVRQQYESPPKPANRVPLQLPPQQRSPARRAPDPYHRGPQQRGSGAPGGQPDSGSRPNGMNGSRRMAPLNGTARVDVRPPPPAHGRRPPFRTPEESGFGPQRDGAQNGLLRHCYPSSPNSSAPSPYGGHPTSPRSHPENYEPRYSKSGKLCPRVPEPRPMPPPVVMLRTGPLGTYPDAETLRRAGQGHDDHPSRHRGDVSQQIFVDTYTHGQSMATDHLAIPYRIPQVSPKKMFEAGVILPSPGGPLQSAAPTCRADVPPDGRTRRSAPPSPYRDGGRPNGGRNVEEGVIYANQQVPSVQQKDYLPDPRRSPPKINGHLYENPPQRGGPRSLSDSCSENLYANHRFFDGTISSDDRKQQHAMKVPRGDRRNTHPPPQKPSTNPLPHPPEIGRGAESRGWNGQTISAHARDVLKPTPRMPRLPNGLLASGAPLATVPAYQCVIHELSCRPMQQVSPDSSPPSLKSGYDSSSGSGRDFRRSTEFESGRTQTNGHKAPGSQIDTPTLLSASMTSLCSDASSSVSSRTPRREDNSWDRVKEESSKRKEKNSVFMASPWDREEKEKLQRAQVLDARRARDLEIAHLESLEERSEKQSEWLRILRLEREFQRRAELELRDDDSSDSEDDQITDFPRDKLTVIPNERMGLKLLDELLDNPCKPPPLSEKDSSGRTHLPPSHTPSEAHFIPVQVASSDPRPTSLPMSLHILQTTTSEPLSQSADSSTGSSRPPVPAPRPSRAAVASHLSELQRAGVEFDDLASVTVEPEGNASSLTKLDISDASSYFCSTDCDGGGATPQENWLIEVPNTFPEEQQEVRSKPEPGRIYENIKPADYQFLRTQTVVSSSGFASHTLPRSSSGSASVSSYGSASVSSYGSAASQRSNGRPPEKKFPSMGVSSTLTKKANGYGPSDTDLLPALYASCKIQSAREELPKDLPDQSPEFQKMWISRPEKLTFQDKIRKFSLQAGEDDPPRDRVKNSRAQREIEVKFGDPQKRAKQVSET